MKKLLLSIAFLASLNAFAQDPIYAFYGDGVTIPEAGPDVNHYLLVTSGTPLNQETAGANIAWNFNNLSVITETTSTSVYPTAADLANYPGTTMVVETITEGGNPTHYYLAIGEGTYLTGAQTSQLTLAYTNSALVGYFPTNYGATTTDNVAGTFNANGTEGTFSGTASTAVDAYGTLTVNEGFEGTKTVTRLKTQQNLTLIYMGFPVGTLNQTTYSYYNADLTSGPVFRSITTHVVIAALGIDQTQSTLESYFQTTNSLPDGKSLVQTAISPNPVADVLHFSGDSEVVSVSIFDATGRTVLQAAQSNDIVVSHLQAGIYNVIVNGASGSKTLKMLKR